MSVVYFDANQDIKFKDYFQRQLGTNWCWAACATSIYNYAAVINANNSSTVQADIVSLQKGKAPYEVGDSGYLLTSTLKFQFSEYVVNDWNSFYDFVVAAFKQGIPVLVSWKQDAENSHNVIVYGYDSSDKSFIILEPQQFKILYELNENFSKEIKYALAIAPPADKKFLMNPLYNELIPDSGIQNFYVQANSCSARMTLDKTIISNGKTYSIETDFAYYIRITKEEDYASECYLATGVKIKRHDHSYTEWLYYGNLLTEAHKDLNVIDTSYNQVYGYKLDNFWVQFVPVAYRTAFTPSA